MSYSFYRKLYQGVSDPFRGKTRLLKALFWIEKTLVALAMAAYGFLAVYALFRREFSYQGVLSAIVLPAGCLLCVSVLRKLIKRARPYEKEGAGIVPLKQKDASGNSFPSRHTACAFVIATVFTAYFPLAGGALYAVGAFIAFFRFLFGLHYPTDLLGGMALGFLFGIPAFFL